MIQTYRLTKDNEKFIAILSYNEDEPVTLQIWQFCEPIAIKVFDEPMKAIDYLVENYKITYSKIV